MVKAINEQSLNWQMKATIAPGGTIMTIVEDEQARLWLTAPAGLFCRDEAGWRAVQRGIPFWRLNCVAVYGRHLWAAGMPGGLVRSANGGKSWHQCWIEQTEAPIIAIAASPDFAHDRTLLAATDGDGVLCSKDGGRHWELSNFGLREFAVMDVVMAPKIGRYEYAYALTENGFYQSPNAGRAWRRIDMGEIQPVALALSPQFVEDRVIYLGTETGALFLSQDAGNSWELVSAAFEPINALTMTEDGALLVGTMAGIHRLESVDSVVPPVSSFPSPVLSLATTANALYAGLVDGLCVSADNGRSWQAITDLSARRFVWYLMPTETHWLAAGPEEGVWQTTDGGQQWQLICAETPVLAVAATSDQIWVCTLDGLIASSDQGKSWQNVWQQALPITALAAPGGAVWAGNSAGNIWRQVGDAWQSITVPFAGQQLVGLLARGEVLLAVVWSVETRMLSLWRLADAAQDWQLWFSQKAGFALPHVALRGQEAIVGVGSYLYHQPEPEAEWQRYRLASPEAPITAVVALEDGWLTAVTDRLLWSRDGVVWTAVENDLRGEAIVSLQVVEDQLVAGTVEGKVWVTSVIR